MDEQGQIYVERLPWESHLARRIKHSSFLGGKPAAAAGYMRIVNGELREINNHSGHYQPTREDFEQVLTQLEQKGIRRGSYKLDLIEPNNWVGM